MLGASSWLVISMIMLDNIIRTSVVYMEAVAVIHEASLASWNFVRRVTLSFTAHTSALGNPLFTCHSGKCRSQVNFLVENQSRQVGVNTKSFTAEGYTPNAEYLLMGAMRSQG